MTSVETSWQRIEAWLQAHAPTLAEQLPPGVSDEELAQAEAEMGGLTLPADFKASYRRHNGWGASRMFLGRLTLYSLAGVVGTWQMMHDLLMGGDFDRGLDWKHLPLHFELADPICPVWWHLGWIPFAGNGSGEEWSIDLAPAPGGQVGQVIDWEHESGPGQVHNTSLEALLAAFAAALEAGHYQYTEGRLETTSEYDAELDRLLLAAPPLVLSPARQLLQQVYETGRAQCYETDIARAIQERLQRPKPVPGPLPIPPQLQPFLQRLKHLWMNEAAAQQMTPLLLAVLDLEDVQLEDRMLAWEWILLIHLALDHREQIKALLPRCQREAEQAPAHYEIHRILREIAAASAEV